MDLWLAIAHHLTVFSLVGVFLCTTVLVRPGMGAEDARRVGRLDILYASLAGLILAVGAARVFFGGKGAPFYMGNPWFWAKMGVFLLAGVLSVPPTLGYLRWKGVEGGPTDAQVAAVRRWLLLEGGLLALVPVFAAAMARWQG